MLCSTLVRRFLLDLSTANLASLLTINRLVCAHNTMTASERNKLHSGQNVQARLSAVMKSRRIRMIFPGFFLLCLMMYSLSPFSSDGHIFHVSERVYETSKNGTFHANVYTDHTHKEMDWSLFAYVQYVTNPTYLCNSLMMLESLNRLGTKADLVMLYPKQWKVPSSPETAESVESAQLARARDEYGAKLVPIEIQSYDAGESIWADSFTKLLLFNQTQYKRVIYLDSDGTLRKVSFAHLLSVPLPYRPGIYLLICNSRSTNSSISPPLHVQCRVATG